MKKKMTKTEKIWFKGDGSPVGKIKNSQVILKPDLTKMSSLELRKWEKKISSFGCCHAGEDDNISIEFSRILRYINFIKKEVLILDHDIISIVKKKRKILDDISLNGVGIVCGGERHNSENVLSVEYY